MEHTWDEAEEAKGKLERPTYAILGRLAFPSGQWLHLPLVHNSFKH